MITVVCSPSERPLLRSRIEQTVGVKFEPAKEPDGYPVIVPNGQWQPVDDDFLNTCCGDWSDQMAAGDYLGFFRLPDNAHDRVIDFMEWYFSPGNRDLIHCQQHEREVSLFEALYQVRNPEEETPTFFGVARGKPGMEVSTIDRAIDWRVGLHIDNFDRLPISERRWARNRISVNVGAERRYLLFVPISAQRLAQLTSSRLGSTATVPAPKGLEHMHLVWQFFELFPYTTIYRLSVGPGEAYIGPTENLIHDGSTLGMTRDDWQMVWLGRFNWPMIRNG